MEQAHPGLRPSVKTRDMLPRVGGTPLRAKPELAMPKEPRQAAVTKRQSLLNRFNPAIGFIIETVGGYSQRRQRFNGGSGDDANAVTGTRFPKGAFANIRTLEFFASAEVDPFVRAYFIASMHAEGANERGTEDFGKAFFELEEAAMQTTALPYNLAIRAGRFFADWGYLGRRHSHDLPQIDVPPSLAQLYGNNATDGIEVSWLAPLPVFAMFTGGWGSRFGSLGEDMLSPFQQQIIQGNTFFGSARTYYELNDDHSLELGFSAIYSPRSRVPEAEENFLAVNSDDRIDRRTFDLDFHYRWYPLGRGLRQSLSVHGEFLWDFGQGRRTTTGNTKFRKTMGGYVYGEYRLSKRWRPGFRFDWRQLPSEPALVENVSTGLSGSTANTSGHRTTISTYSPYITWYPSEFNRFVLQYNNIQHGNAKDNHQLFLQWQVVIGSHQHGFTERD
ncbi:MAG: hypothetical protein GKS05_02180 [Nitrospirales bacterium]|nr:hypothetical protein [Nitrospirales bacterium]